MKLADMLKFHDDHMRRLRNPPNRKSRELQEYEHGGWGDTESHGPPEMSPTFQWG